MGDQRKMSISERRATYPLQERLKIYGPETMAQRFNDQGKHTGKFVVNGVNILNKNSLDSDTMMHRIKQRRETHNRVERRRRDKLNGLVHELAQALPVSMEAEKHHRAKILRLAIDYIHIIEQENHQMKDKLGYPNEPSQQLIAHMESLSGSSRSPSTSPILDHTSPASLSPQSSSGNNNARQPPLFDTFCFNV
ncbi:hypothetical protein DM01DRAFT_1380602 [Hesseltinella vesiculosa]|uniref:BHLH domain-containing protein n=1 Tax=Hesseltinella vesiculosa TaxID=101127 RepID=A0A1X2GUX7_9FUNG|nr:hypothetical protein DM01DRAFT_1380602 [Hesseltinella vesiculosa]